MNVADFEVQDMGNPPMGGMTVHTLSLPFEAHHQTGECNHVVNQPTFYQHPIL